MTTKVKSSTIDSVANTQISGLITSAQIASVAAAKITGTVATATSAANITDYTINQSVANTSSVRFASLGVGTNASGTTGEIRATNNITGYYTSDKKFKENIRVIPDALSKVDCIGGKLFEWTDEYIKNHGGEDGYFVRKEDFGVVAQDLQEVFPIAVREKDDGTLAVDYEKLCALAFAAIKELKAQVDDLQKRVN